MSVAVTTLLIVPVALILERLTTPSIAWTIVPPLVALGVGGTAAFAGDYDATRINLEFACRAIGAAAGLAFAV